MTEVTEDKAREALESGAKKISEEDLKKVLEKRDEIENKFRGAGPLGKFIADLKTLFSMVADYVDGSYRQVPFWTIAAIAAALLYVLSPVDLIPDFIPVIGYVDDALVVALCLTMIEQDINSYIAWKKSQV